jgi:hypothetical protein
LLKITPSPTPPGVVRWTACETYTWVAFGEARPIGAHIEFPAKEWSRDWKHWPPTWLSNAFVEIETGSPWKPDLEVVSGPAADVVRARARRIIQNTGETARQLNDLLTADIEQSGRNQDKLRQAFRDVMAAVRAGHLTVEARPAHRFGKPNISAVHQVLDPKLFIGPREISLFGVVDYAGPHTNEFDPRPENDFAFMDYEGPWFDDVRFDAEQVQALWKLPSGTARTIVAEHNLARWLVARMKASPDHSPGKSAIKNEAEADGYSFSMQGFNRAWAYVVNEADAPKWSAPGAKSKR